MIKDPMRIDQLDLMHLIQLRELPVVVPITQLEFDLLQTKDPTRIYVIIDAVDRRIYLGDILVVRDRPRRMYLIGQPNEFGEYPIFLNKERGWDDQLIEVCRFKNSDEAIKALDDFTKAGSHHDWVIKVYNLLICYILKDLSIHELLIGIIGNFGWRDDIRLQEVIQLSISYDIFNNPRDLPILLREELFRLRDHENPLFQIYADLYDLVVIYNHFNESRFRHMNRIRLDDVIAKIPPIFIDPKLRHLK